MSIFADIEITWKGETYTLSGDSQIMRAIAVIEDQVTLNDIVRAQRGNVPLAKISSAYGALLRFAGASVTDAEVYFGMFEGNKTQEAVQTAVIALMEMMIPPGAMEDEPKKKKGRRKKK